MKLFRHCEDGIVTVGRIERISLPTYAGSSYQFEKVTEFVADQYREDLKSMGIAGGNRGFALDLNPYLHLGCFIALKFASKKTGTLCMGVLNTRISRIFSFQKANRFLCSNDMAESEVKQTLSKLLSFVDFLVQEKRRC